jgi:cyanophycinase
LIPKLIKASKDALLLYFNNLFHITNVITDTHFDNPDRRGRLMAFLARMNQDYEIVGRGIGTDESTAVCIESNGTCRVFDSGIVI